MADALLVKLDPSIFRWTELSTKDGFSRMLGGAAVVHDVWNRFHKGDTSLFLGVHVDIDIPTNEARLKQAAYDAWLWLRFNVPTIAAVIEPTDDGTSRLVYKLGDHVKVEDWASRTFSASSELDLDLDLVCTQARSKKIPSEEGDQTWGALHLSECDERDGSVKKFIFTIYTHHSPFDGNGLKVLMNKYLTQLTRNLSDTTASPPDLAWGTEGANLAPSAFNILLPSVPRPIMPGSPEEPTFDHPFYGNMAVNPYGFKPRKGENDWPSHAREDRIFTAAESTQILLALKSKGADAERMTYTVSHLAHAALAMTAIADNPPTINSKDQYLNDQLFRDCRNFLVEPYSSREGYAGYALGVSGIHIPVKLFLSEDGEPLSLNKDILAAVMKHVRELYNSQKGLPDPMNYMSVVGRMVAQQTIAAFKANMQFPTNNCYSLSSDGISEKWLNPEFFDESGATVFSVSKFILSINRVDPAPFFRITSWKGTIVLSADYNANLVSAAEVKIYMNNWKRFMFLVVGLGGDNF